MSFEDPICIVGIGCRFPPDCGDAESFWRFLKAGGSAVREVPAERWSLARYFNADSNVPGTSVARWGGFLAPPFPAGFDAGVFDMPPNEAAALDPQHRLLLEVSWEALENAGLVPDLNEGRPVGVFVAISTSDYQGAKIWSPGLTGADPFSATGASFAAAAGRLSYTFGFEGPCLAIDSACSSSLVAVHQACQALRNGECEAALVAGVNALLAPNLYVCLSKMGMLSPDGRCKAFDASGNGYVRAEGAGALVIKTRDQAAKDGDRVLAMIRGSAVNQDGRSANLTAPRRDAQEKVIRRALAQAGLEVGDIGYVEAHGTGTPLGDVVEMSALAATYGVDRDAATPLLVGSVKTNIGHLEAGAGIAGLIKAVQCLRHGEIPAHLHLKTPNPEIPWSQYPFKVPTETTAWPAGERPRRAGVSSFGFSGTNAHVILEEAPAEAPRPTTRPSAYHVLPLSARSPEALRALALTMAEFLSGEPAPVADICHTAGIGRRHFPYRLAVVGRDAAELAANLRQNRPPAPPTTRARLAFLFADHGPAAPAALPTLYAEYPAFRAALDACRVPLDGTAAPPLANFALHYGLFRLWRSWGLMPSVVCGHGAGEIMAAHAAGRISLAEALRLAGREDNAEVQPRPGRLPMVSTVSGGRLDSASWRQPAPPGERVADALATLAADGISLFLEIGADATLTERARAESALRGRVVLASLCGCGGDGSGGGDDRRQPLETLAALYTGGADVDWSGVIGPALARKVTMPSYPFQRQPHYISPVPETCAAAAPPTAPDEEPGRLARLLVERRKPPVSALINDLARAVLSTQPMPHLDDELPLVEQGFSSLLGLALRRKLELALGARLPVTLLYNYPSIGHLTDYFLTDFLLTDDWRPDAEPPPSPASLAASLAATPTTLKAGDATADLEFAHLDAMSFEDLLAEIEHEVSEP